MSQGTMHILDNKGDTKILWDSSNPDEVDNAKRTFDRLKQKGFLAYSVTRAGDKSQTVTAFDPAAEKLILSPPMAGG